MHHRKKLISILLHASSALTAAALLAGEAQAQENPAPAAAEAPVADAAAPAAPAAAPADDTVEEVVVTGTLFRRTRSETASPVTVLSADTLAQRGITTVADAVRSLSSDNSGSVPTAFSGGFASGASGVSLRGLSVNSTLTLFDGLRGAYYPLADDGQRNFVDLNTIPEAVIDRIEVLRDGASSTYGADAIGGVVNVITRKSFAGLEASAEAGVSQHGDAGERRVTLLAGAGNLKEDGWNFYVGGEYQRDGLVMASDRGFPYNTGDLTSIGGINSDAGVTSAGSTISAVVRPATQSVPGNIFSGVAVPGGLFSVLSPNGCAAGTIAHTNAKGSFCEQDYLGDYSAIQPRQTRLGVTARGSIRLGGVDAYAMGTYYQNRVFTPGFQPAIRQTTPILTTNIILPARLTNGQLNPNNPYAAQGLAAQIFYRFGDIPASAETLSRTWRGAVGASGRLGDNWSWSADATAMHTSLDINARGYLNIAGLTKAINEGTYNFVDPSKNSDTIRHQIAPDVQSRATSDLAMAQASVTGRLLELPGGPLQLGVGAAARYEKVNAPSANPTGATLGLNAYSAQGHHNVEAGYFEVDAPILKQLELNASGRFDHYSEGYSRFSPKLGVKLTPVRQLALRGTWSKGFRAPQFAETAGNVIGYINSPPIPCNIVIAHGGTATAGGGCTGGSAYVTTPYRLGLNTSATPDIKPETSRSFTLGAVFQPVRWFSMTVDYYDVRKTNVIVGGPDYGAALAAYYAGKPLPSGYTVTLNGADPDNPNAIRTVAFVNSPYVNAASQRATGLDVTATVQVPLAHGVKLTSQLDLTDMIRSSLTTAGGTANYFGTQGPYVLSSGAGTPKWRGSWSNSLEWGPATVTATAYYTSGYRSTAEDVTGPGSGGDCANALYDPAFCRTKRFIDVDLVASYRVSDNLSVWANVLNVLDTKAPLNPANYATLNYNPTWSQAGAIGRAFRAGARIRF